MRKSEKNSTGDIRPRDAGGTVPDARSLPCTTESRSTDDQHEPGENTIIELSSRFPGLSPRHLRVISYYFDPASETWQNRTRSWLKEYRCKDTTARVEGSRFFSRPEVIRGIEALNNEILPARVDPQVVLASVLEGYYLKRTVRRDGAGNVIRITESTPSARDIVAAAERITRMEGGLSKRGRGENTRDLGRRMSLERRKQIEAEFSKPD